MSVNDVSAGIFLELLSFILIWTTHCLDNAMSFSICRSFPYSCVTYHR